jgi:hypothetical protein
MPPSMMSQGSRRRVLSEDVKVGIEARFSDGRAPVLPIAFGG